MREIDVSLPQRYTEKPLLLLVESYVLRVLGLLDPRQDAAAEVVCRRVWPGHPVSEWDRVLRAELGWSESIDETIVRNWDRYVQAAQAQQVDPNPSEFAAMFADAVANASG